MFLFWGDLKPWHYYLLSQSLISKLPNSLVVTMNGHVALFLHLPLTFTDGEFHSGYKKTPTFK